MSSGAKVNSQAVADMITALVTMQNKMMAMERASVGAFEKGGRRHFAPGKNQKSHRRLQ